MKGFGVIVLFIGILTTIVGACMLGSSTDYKIQKEVLNVEKVDNDLYGFFNVNGLKFKKQITEEVYEKLFLHLLNKTILLLRKYYFYTLLHVVFESTIYNYK